MEQIEFLKFKSKTQNEIESERENGPGLKSMTTLKIETRKKLLNDSPEQPKEMSSMPQLSTVSPASRYSNN